MLPKTRRERWIVAGLLLTIIAASGVVGRWQSRCERSGHDGPADLVREAAWDGLVGAGKQEVTNSFGPVELKMAKTNVALDGWGYSLTFKHAIWPGMDGLNLYAFGDLSISLGSLALFQITGVTDSGHPGQYGFQVTATPEPFVQQTFWTDVPETGYTFVEIELAVTGLGSCLESTAGENPIGEKTSTHAKERTITENWFIPANASYTVSVNGFSETHTTTSDIPSISTIAISGNGLDCDDWTPGYYPLLLDDVKFNGVGIDVSAFNPITWGGTAASVNKLWMRGVGDHGIGFYVSEAFYNGAYVYNTLPSSTINAPYSYDFSNMAVKWMDGTDASTVKVYCPAIRVLSTQADVDAGLAAAVGKDMGPWTGTLAALQGIGRYTQKHGCYFWDTYDPDMTNVVTLYMKYDSMREQGFLTHPKPTVKVEGCMYGVTGTEESFTTSPIDGDYWLAGLRYELPVYSKGDYEIFPMDASGDSWGIGVDQSVPPYYIAEDGGPYNIYFCNETDYEDAIIDEETGQRRFTGWTGLGPAVSAQPNPVDPDTSTPSFGHDGTMIFNCWPLSATDRTSAPDMSDVVQLTHSDWINGNPETVDPAGCPLYKDAHTHEDWVGDGCTTPDANGNFTAAAGGTLTLSLRSYYITRQAGTYIPLPNRYWIRKADYHYGSYPTEEPLHEAPYDWRGWSYLKNAVTLPEGVTNTTVTVTIKYYMDLDGTSDNHMTGGERDRETEYTYTPGELFTYTREATIGVVDGNRKATFITDLYWADPVLANVQSIEYTFTDAGAYVLHEPALVSDMGDPQTGREVYVNPELGFANHGGLHKFFESPRYAQGGFSGVYDGIFERQLYIPDNVKANEIEYCFPTLNVLIGAKSGIDMTTNIALSGVPIGSSCEAWNWSHSPSAEAAHMKDADGAVLKTLNCYDIVPVMGSDSLNVAVRCYQITCVRGLPYTFHGTHWVGGAGHGMCKTSGGERKRTFYPYKDVADLCTRAMGSEDEDDYVVAEDDVRADEHGHWHDADGTTGGGPATSGQQELYDWAVFGRAYANLGQFHTREYCAADVLVGIAGNPFLCLDILGQPVWMVNEEDGDINCFRIDGQFGNVKYAVEQPFADGLHTWASIAVNNCGWLFVAATNTATGNMDIAVSHNNGRTWEAPVATLGAGLQYGTIWHDSGQIKIAGWADGKVYFASASNPTTLARDVLTGAATTLEVATAPKEGGVIPRSSGCVDSTRKDIVAVGGATDTHLYTCNSFAVGFSPVV